MEKISKYCKKNQLLGTNITSDSPLVIDDTYIKTSLHEMIA